MNRKVAEDSDLHSASCNPVLIGFLVLFGLTLCFTWLTLPRHRAAS